MDLINSKNPITFNKPQIIALGNCRFRVFNEDKSVDAETCSKLAPYLDNDGECTCFTNEHCINFKFSFFC